MFTRQHYIAIASSILLVGVLYFGCDRIPRNHKSSQMEHNTATNDNDEAVGEFIQLAKKKLSPDAAAKISSLEQRIAASKSDTTKSALLKQLSSIWYSQDQKVAAGFFANEVATIDKTERSWFIAGSTLFDAINESQEPSIRNFCSQAASSAFDNAISFAPNNVSYQINKALCFTENPPQDNPMKGILMLRELDTKYPENPQVLFQLAKLAMRTNQFDKAVARLEQILKKIPNNAEAICLLSDAYRGKGDAAQADKLAKQCASLFKK